MPIHDWTRVPSGLFHEFHQSWSVRLKDALNTGVLPKGFYAMVEQRIGGPEPDVIAVSTGIASQSPTGSGTAIATATASLLRQRSAASDAERYARRANRIIVRHPLGDVIAVIEIVSPGNKDGVRPFREFVAKAVEFLRAGVHVLVIDLFPPTPRDPHGIHHALFGSFVDEPTTLPTDKPLTLVSYEADSDIEAYLHPTAVGEPLFDMPLFLAPGMSILTPLESTYEATWNLTPEPIRAMIA